MNSPSSENSTISSYFISNSFITTFNTSLMPTKSGTAFVSYSDREYIGIPDLLNEKGLIICELYTF